MKKVFAFGSVLVLMAIAVITGVQVFDVGVYHGNSASGFAPMLFVGSIANIFTTRTMLSAIEKFPKVKTAFLDMFFKKVDQSITESVDIDIYEGSRRIAPFVHPNLPGKLVERKGFTTKNITPPYIKLLSVASASEVFKNRPIGKNLYEAVPGNLRQRAMDLLAKDLVEFDKMITRREEVMAHQAITTGKITVNGEGYDGGASAYEIDFGQPSDFRPVLSGAALWSAPTTCECLTKLREYRSKISLATGYTPNKLFFSPEAFPAFLACDEVKQMVNSLRINIGAVERADMPDGTIYYGVIDGWEMYTYDEQYVDDWTTPATPVTKPMVPAKSIIIGVDGSKTRNARHYGSIIDLDDENAGLNAVRLFPKIWPEKNPSRMLMLLQSAPLVAAHEPKSFMCVQVLA
jgi:hypothetical protein